MVLLFWRFLECFVSFCWCRILLFGYHFCWLIIIVNYIIYRYMTLQIPVKTPGTGILGGHHTHVCIYVYIYILLAYHAFLSIFLSLLRVHVHVLANLIFFIFATNPRFKVGACAAQFFTMMNAQTAPENFNPILLQRILMDCSFGGLHKKHQNSIIIDRGMRYDNLFDTKWRNVLWWFLCVTCVLCLNWKTYFLLKPGLG